MIILQQLRSDFLLKLFFVIVDDDDQALAISDSGIG